MRSENFWETVTCRLNAGMPVFISMVVAHTRGSPGTTGAHFMLDDQGGQAGTMGGGIMEANLIKRAKELLASGEPLKPELEPFVHRKVHTDHPSGLICAGEQKNLHFTLTPADAKTIEAFCQALKNQAKQQADLVIDAQGIRVDSATAHTPNPTGIQLQEDGDTWEVRESNLNPRRIAIVGAGHCGQALAKLANEVGYWVDIYDNRPSIIEQAQLPSTVRQHLLGDYAELTTAIGHTDLTHVVVMTTAAFDDIDALAAVADKPWRWIGVMGARAKLNLIHKTLKERGISQADIDKIHGPIGLDIKSDTPPEIAVSVMGQLLQEAAKTRTHQLKHV